MSRPACRVAAENTLKVFSVRVSLLQRNEGGPMARIAAPVSERPEWKPPRLDLEAVPARHKANLAAARQTRAVLLHAARAVATLQAGRAKALITRARDVP